MYYLIAVKALHIRLLHCITLLISSTSSSAPSVDLLLASVWQGCLNFVVSQQCPLFCRSRPPVKHVRGFEQE
jgi:hypothetical protein